MAGLSPIRAKDCTQMCLSACTRSSPEYLTKFSLVCTPIANEIKSGSAGNQIITGSGKWPRPHQAESEYRCVLLYDLSKQFAHKKCFISNDSSHLCGRSWKTRDNASKPWKRLHESRSLPYYLEHTTMVLWPVSRTSNYLGSGFISWGGPLKCQHH
jgi:hypothetical protein